MDNVKITDEKLTDFNIQEDFIRIWVKHSNMYGNGYFEYSYDIKINECHKFFDTLRERYEDVEFVIAHLGYGEFINENDFNKLAKVSMYI